jgi:hypothetical protein
MTTHSLAEAATLICGSPSKAEWLAIRLRRGEIPGYKVGRQWRMTQADVDKAIDALRPRRVAPMVPQMGGLTKTSARRLSA